MIRAVSEFFGEKFDFEHYSLPSISKGFMGDRKIEHFEVPKAMVTTDAGATSLSSESGADHVVPAVPNATADADHIVAHTLTSSPETASTENTPVVVPTDDIVVATAAAAAVPTAVAVPAAPAAPHPQNAEQDKDNEFHSIPASSSRVPEGVRFWTQEKESGLFHISHHRYYVVEDGKFSVYRRAIPHAPYGNDLIGLVDCILRA